MKKIDIFGSEMLLRFNKSSSFHTNFGSFITIMIVGFISFRLFFIVLDVFQRNNPQVIYNERQVDNPAPFQASSKTFPFAFGMEDPVTNNYYIDESIYTITAQWKQKFLVYNETTKQYVTIWNITNIQLQKCSIENFQNLDNQHYYTQLNYTSMYCLPPDYQYTIQGDFPSLEYSLILLTIQQCSQNCKPKSDLDFYLQKANFGLQLSDSYVDPTIKNNPFKIYSRDMFWRTSTSLPKDVTLYIRNNYVYSDFGWFFSDITTQSFPAYSYYEVSDYPPNSQKYFLSILFRFEKQKEGVYKRTYKNFNSIMSEIGGFTQSLLAIGYLFCKKYSQIKLNLKLINEAFKYEEDEKNNKEKLCNNKQEKQQRLKTLSFQPNKLKNELDFKNSNLEIEQSQNILRKRNFLDRKESMDVKQNQNETIQNSPFQLEKNILSSNQLFQLTQVKPDQINPRSTNDALHLNQQVSESFQEQQQKHKQIKIQNKLGGVDESDYIKNNEPNIDQSQKNYYQQQKTKETEFKQLIDKHTKSMKLSTWEYFKSFIFPTREYKRKKKIIQYSVDKLYYNLDIFNILKKFVEVEKLKRLLLDQDQQKLFDYLPKPTIQQDLVLKQEIKESWDQKSKEIDLLYQDNRSDLQKANDAFQAYQKIIKKSNCTKLDQKLIDLIDPNLLKIFKEASDQKQLYSLGKHNLQNSKLSNAYEKYFYQTDCKSTQSYNQNNSENKNKMFKLFKQRIQEENPLEQISLNQSDISIQEEFVKVEFKDRPNSPIQLNSITNSEVKSQSPNTFSQNQKIKYDQQHTPKLFKSKQNQLGSL
ncbi:small GTP-binding domain protein (macronuclear) [Tetrahymena thermophila SB210]|uniref:Small GTP-binding domain protein n=1 Tax=Tetrahymena thermophila (strain SB210) TaxID=312017 RepID=I7M101_TETTS|nr:small GTP-binding domain protein [Tetrahymena thermophila SB210]EAR93761.2 small GTP-binding domain protein [Tetrahymena thermophila SB210]|eukprot:XP_001014006.2 small GTP-binding domain protein [Tetrahymena thermophila SB210]